MSNDERGLLIAATWTVAGIFGLGLCAGILLTQCGA